MSRDGSDSDYMYEQGFTSVHGGELDNSFHRESAYVEAANFSKKLKNSNTILGVFKSLYAAVECQKSRLGSVITMYSLSNGFLVEIEHEQLSSAREAFRWGRANPGSSVSRNEDGNGFEGRLAKDIAKSKEVEQLGIKKLNHPINKPYAENEHCDVLDETTVFHLLKWADEHGIHDLISITGYGQGLSANERDWLGLPRDKKILAQLQHLTIGVCVSEYGSDGAKSNTKKYLGYKPNRSIVELPMEIGSLVNLKSLEICNMDSLESIYSIGQLSNLTHLTIGNNKSLKGLSKQIGKLSKLTHLIIHYNLNLTELPIEIGQLTNLTHLTISYNEKLINIPAEIGQLSNLTHLSISNNPNLVDLPKELGQLSKLKELSFYLSLDDRIKHANPIITKLCRYAGISTGSNIGGYHNNFQVLPSEIGQLGNLIKLDITDCKKLTLLPPEIGQLSKLERLTINYNPNLRELPNATASIANLKSLSIYRCGKIDKLPPQTYLLKELDHINIGYTGIYSHLEDLIPLLPKLKDISATSGFAKEEYSKTFGAVKVTAIC